jgi:hypothetical protein
VENVCTVVGNQPSEDLAKSLWGRIGASIKVIDTIVVMCDLTSHRVQ